MAILTPRAYILFVCVSVCVPSPAFVGELEECEALVRIGKFPSLPIMEQWKRDFAAACKKRDVRIRLAWSREVWPSKLVWLDARWNESARAFVQELAWLIPERERDRIARALEKLTEQKYRLRS